MHGTSNQDLLADPSSDSDGTNGDNDHVPNKTWKNGIWNLDHFCGTFSMHMKPLNLFYSDNSNKNSLKIVHRFIRAFRVHLVFG